MRIAVLSDLHLGVPQSVLVERVADSPRPGVWDVREELVDRIARAVVREGEASDYLILMGDLFDLSLVPLDEAWEAARAFLAAVAKRKMATHVVFMPGNHDFSMWQYFEQDLRITRRTQKVPPQRPLPIRHSVPGILDSTGLSVPDATAPLGGGFFGDLWPVPGGEFCVVFPNLYVRDGDRTTLLTHGQYFDGFWRFLGDLSRNCAGPHLPQGVQSQPTVPDEVQLNYPTSVLTAAAMGQAELFGEMSRSIKDAWDAQGYGPGLAIRDRIVGYLRLRISRMGACARLLGPPLVGFLGWVAGLLMIWGSRSKLPRWNFEYVAEHQEGIGDYLELSRRELSSLLNRPVAGFERLVFGHTHVPTVEGETTQTAPGADGTAIPSVNTGGWIRDGKGAWRGGLVEFDDSRPEGSRWTSTVFDDSGPRRPFVV